MAARVSFGLLRGGSLTGRVNEVNGLDASSSSVSFSVCSVQLVLDELTVMQSLAIGRFGSCSSEGISALCALVAAFECSVDESSANCAVKLYGTRAAEGVIGVFLIGSDERLIDWLGSDWLRRRNACDALISAMVSAR